MWFVLFLNFRDKLKKKKKNRFQINSHSDRFQCTQLLVAGSSTAAQHCYNVIIVNNVAHTSHVFAQLR